MVHAAISISVIVDVDEAPPSVEQIKTAALLFLLEN
jgi:hypothetical protein